jgi:MFS family permease
VFWLCGVICSLWSASLPALNARLHLGETRLGVALLMVGAGAMAIMPVTGRLCDRWTSRAVLRVGGPVTALTLIGPALAPGFPVLLVAAFVLGSGIGSLDVAMNTHAIAVEQRYGRPIMSAFHGLWSVGGVAGSAVIAAGLHLGAHAPALMTAGACAASLLLLLPGPLLLTGGGEPAARASRREPGACAAAARRGIVLLLGLVAAAGFLCEGAAYSWAPLHAIRELHADPATAALAYTVFAASLTAGRLVGDRIRRWLGPVRTIAVAGAIAVCGYLIVLLAPSLPAGGLPFDFAGWGVTGMGLATVVPGIFSAVGELDQAVGRAMSLVATCAYAGELGGPAVIGPVAGATSLRIALLVPTVLTVLITIVGPIAVRRAARPVGPKDAFVTVRPAVGCAARAIAEPGTAGESAVEECRYEG